MLRRYMSVPQLEQKWFVMVFPVAMVADWEKVESEDSPLRWVREEVFTMKLEANIEAVILWQSLRGSG